MSQTHHSDDHHEPGLGQLLLSALLWALPGIAKDAGIAVMFGLTLWLGSMLVVKVQADAQLRTEMLNKRAETATSQNHVLCRKWGIAPDSAGFTLCVRDLGRLRHNLDWRQPDFAF